MCARAMSSRIFPGATHRLGLRQAARWNTLLNVVAAYSAMSPPMEEPAIMVFSRSGSVR